MRFMKHHIFFMFFMRFKASQEKDIQLGENPIKRCTSTAGQRINKPLVPLRPRFGNQGHRRLFIIDQGHPLYIGKAGGTHFFVIGVCR